MSATLRLSVVRGLNLEAPQLETTMRNGDGRHQVTIGIAPDLMDAAKDAVRAMIRYLVETRDLTRQDAYVLCSVAADPRIARSSTRRSGSCRRSFPCRSSTRAAHEDTS